MKMKKSVIGIIVAVALVVSPLVYPVQVHAAADVPEGQTRENVAENESVDINYGTITNNNGTVNINYYENGTINSNKGTINKNDGTVDINEVEGQIKSSLGTVTTNDGTIFTTGTTGTVVTNNGTLENNYHVVVTNNGTVKENAGGGTVETNNGTVECNHGNGCVTINAAGGTITTNDGVVNENATGGTITDNNGTVTINNGTIENNYSDVANEGGTVTNNYGGNVTGGAVDNNYGGTVTGGNVTNNYGGGTVSNGTILNQWYEFIINGGTCKTASNRTDAGEKTWIGKAESAHEEFGSYYITVTPNSGMIFDYAEFEDGETATYTTNADGSYTFGNLTKAISIFFKKIIRNDDGNSNNTNNDAKSESIEELIAREMNIPVTEFMSDAAMAKLPEAARDIEISYNLSSISTVRGFAAAIYKISEAVNVLNSNSRGTGKVTSVTVYSDHPLSFTADILKTIKDSGIDFVFVFMHEGKMYRVTIPKGANIDFTGHYCEGPLYIGKLLGTSEVIG